MGLEAHNFIAGWSGNALRARIFTHGVIEKMVPHPNVQCPVPPIAVVP